jgi:hypothetical protein
MVEGPLEGDRRAAGQERRVDDVAVTDDPTDVRGRPPDVVLPQAEDPVPHGVDVHGVGPVRVHRQLGFRRGARGGQDVERFVGLHPLHAVALTRAQREEVVPPQLPGAGLGLGRLPAQHHHLFDALSGPRQRVVHDPLQRHVLALSPGQVGVEDRLRAGETDSLRERAGAEAGEDYDVHRSDPGAGEHQGDRLGAGGHVDGDPVTAPDPEPSEGRGCAPHFVLELRVGEHPPLTALVLADQRGPTALPALDMPVHAVPGQVGDASLEPSEIATPLVRLLRVPVEDPLPRPPPAQPFSRPGPESVRVAGRRAAEGRDAGVDQLDLSHLSPPIRVRRGALGSPGDGTRMPSPPSRAPWRSRS